MRKETQDFASLQGEGVLSCTSWQLVILDSTEVAVRRLTDEAATEIMRRITKCDSTADFQKLEADKRRKLITKLKNKGLSIRQISGLTGETYYMIRKAQ